MPANSPETSMTFDFSPGSTAAAQPESSAPSTTSRLPKSTDAADVPPDDRGPSHIQAVDQLHQACGVYTLPAVAGRILDQVGWSADSDLSKARLLEPAAGAGEFVLRAAIRLVDSYRNRGIEPRARQLRTRITAFELHPGAAGEARQRVREALRCHGLHHRTASACSTAWIRNADFLLSDPPIKPYTHVVGNPPYLRWSKVPKALRSDYQRCLPPEAARGDIFLPFLDRSLALLGLNGRIGFLCADRWLYMAFAERFRLKWLPRLEVLANDPIPAATAFDRPVAAYPTVLIAAKRRTPRRCSPALAPSKGRTLEELGCTIRVGPALGHTPAFVLERGEQDVEAELLHPWLDSTELPEGAVEWKGRQVISVFDDRGRLREIKDFPLLAQRLRRFEPELRGRSIVKNGAPWYRTIDRLRPLDWQAPKLLIPGLAKSPQVALDRSGAVPSNGVYAVFPPEGQTGAIRDRLRDGRLAAALDGIAPTLRNGYVRCYKHFLLKIRV